MGKPTGFSSTDATLHLLENETLIRSGKHAVIHWDDFSISPDELVRFLQQDSTSSVINRVRGHTRTEILGQLLSNGQVFLINPNGILIGPTGLIETSGFTASTLDLLSLDLSQHFKGDSLASVTNHGTIRCPLGEIYLIGKTVENTGTLNAKKQALLAGTDVLLSPDKAPLFLIRDAASISPETLEENPYALAIRHSGSIEGDAYLMADEGLIEVSGKITAENGTVHVLADYVHLKEGAEIDVSAKNGAGTILIGGDFQGSNPNVKNAKRTFVEPGVTLKANAVEMGDGGRVIIWADDATHYYGSIDARAGQVNGDGGFVEISGDFLEFMGLVDASSATGNAGMLLLDPTDITISGTGAPSGGSFTAGVWTSTAAAATIPSTTNANSIQTLLVGGTSVTIDTAAQSGGPFAGNGTITWAAANAITWSSNASLTLTAEREIILNSSINYTGSTHATPMTFTAAGTGTAAYVGITIAATAGIRSSFGSVVLSGTSSSTSGASHGIDVLGSFTMTGTSSVSLTGVGAPSSAASHGINFSNNGSVNTAGGTITLAGMARGTATSTGITFANANNSSITSATGTVLISGTSTSTGNSSHGVIISNTAISIGTTGDVIFQNCVGGNTGVGSAGIALTTSFTTAGNIIATNNILAGNGDGSNGFQLQIGTFSTTGDSTKSIQITATSQTAAGGSGASGIVVLTNGKIRAANGAVITLSGTGGLSGGDCSGVSLGNASAVLTSTGTITLSGQGRGTGLTYGVKISSSGSNSVVSTSGNIILSGSSTSTNTGSAGVVILTNPWSPGTTGDVIFQNCTGPSTGGSGVLLSGSVTLVGNLIATNNILSGSASTSNGWFATAGILSTSGNATKSIQIAATSQAVGGGTTGSGIILQAATITAQSGAAITLSGTSSTVNGTGIQISGVGVVSTSSGTITMTGISRGTGATNIGLNLTGSNLISTSGNVFLTGQTTGASGTATGVSITGSTAVGTTGDITFSNCTSVTGTAISAAATFTTAGNIFATNTITGGTAANTNAFSMSAGNFGTTGDSTKSIQITALSTAASGTGNGITLTAGSMSANNGASIILNGTVQTGASGNGINLSGSAANRVTTSTGTISLTGLGRSSSVVVRGVNIAVTTVTSAITSTSGPIIISGQSLGTIAASHGVFVSSAWSALTTGTVSFSSCSGGSGATSHGINIGATFTTAGSIIATSSIVSGSGSGSIGFLSGTVSTSGSATQSVQITASSVATAGAAHGISIATGSISTTAAFITLAGTSDSSNTASHGIDLSAANAITSSTGTMTLSGTTSAAAASSHGINIGAAWAAGTSGTITFLNCKGGTGSTNHAINVGGTFTTAGSIIATTSIVSGTGSGSIGVLCGTMSTSGSATQSIQITASSVATAGAAHGISITSGSISTTAAFVTLLGTSGVSNTASYGINLGVLNPITSSTGSMTLTGVSQGTADGSHGIFMSANWTTGTTGTVSLTGTAGNSSNANSYPIALNGNLTTSGPLIFNSLVELLANSIITANGSGNMQFLGSPTSLAGNFNATLSATGAAISTTGAVNLAGATNGGTLTATAGNALTFGGDISTQGTSGNGGAISLTSTSSTISAQAVTASGGTNGGNLTATAALSLTFAGNITTQGTSGNGGNISLTSTGDSISVQGVTASGGTNGGDITIAPSGTYSGGLPTGLLILNGAITSTGATTSGDIILSASRAAAATVATITSSFAGNNISITGATITLGAFEAMTALGSITLTAPIMTVGDLVALTSLTLTATTVNLNLHGNITLLASDGSFYTSPTLHFLSGAAYSPSGTFVPSGPIRAESLTTSSSEFRPQLLFGTQILNFDIPRPLPPFIPFQILNSTRQHLIYELLIADTELTDRLPFRLCRLPSLYRFCKLKDVREVP